MPLLLRHRAKALREQMDDPHCDELTLRRTYAGFAKVNRLVSAWPRIYTRYIRPLARSLERPSLLDVGFGGGDIPLNLAKWATRDGLELDITAIEVDERAFSFARERLHPPQVRFELASTEDLTRQGRRFDIVTSNHLLHHLSGAELEPLCWQSQALARHRVIHNDIERGDLAYAGFALTAPFFTDSFITPDGLRSIRRSFCASELRQVAPKGWQVERLFPYRLLLTWQA